MDITEDQAKEILSPYHHTLHNCIIEAWKSFHAKCYEIKHIFSSRTQASAIFDFIKSNVTQTFHGNKKVSISEKRGLFLVNFENKVVVRFKKLKNNKASCIPTRQTLDFFKQLELPGIPSPERFIIGYQLNNIKTEIKNISVVYPKSSNQNYWSYDLEPCVAQVIETPFIQIPIEQEILPKEERIIIKEATKKGVIQDE